MVLVTGCNIKIENGNKPVCEAIQLSHKNGEVICIDPPFEMNEPHILKFKQGKTRIAKGLKGERLKLKQHLTVRG